MFESYLLTTDGKEYVDVDDVRAVLGIKEYENIFRAIEKLKEERDQLKEKCDKLKKRANAAYGVSCGHSGNKTPAFLCNVISYSWELAPIEARSLMDEPSYCVSNNTIRVELELTPTANYKGTFDPEDLRQYINNYGREKKLGIVESVDYQNAKAARAELAYLYKQVLGKEKLDRDLSPHGVMKAILDEYKRVRDSQFASDQCLRSVYMHVYEGTGYDISDIYAAPDKLADGIITRYNSARMSSRLETLSEIDEHVDELCEKYTVVQPDRKSTTKERLDYIFGVLAEYRDLANNNFNKAEGFRKEKRAVENVLIELRAKVREIYRSVVDDEWDEYLAYTSALNDINEEYKRVVHNFEERTADWSKAQQEFDRYKLAVGSLCDIPAERRDDISWIEDAFNYTKKDYLKWKTTADKLARLRSNICTALCLGGETSDEDILNAIAKMREEINKRIVFRNDVAKAIGLTWTDSNPDIINRVMETKECHDKLCKDYTELRKAIWEAMDRKPETLPDETARLVGEVTELARGEKLLIEFRDDIAKAIGSDYPTTNNVILRKVQYIYKDRKDAYEIVSKLNDQVRELSKAEEEIQQQVKAWTNRCIGLADTHSEMQAFRIHAIEDLKARGFCFRPEENATLPEIYDKLLKSYDWAYGEYKEQYRLRQMWHVRWESENERANGVQKALDREREKCRVKDISLETAKKQYKKVCDNLETAECALNGMKSKIRELQKENAGLKKDVASLTGDTSVDLYEEEGDE